MQAVRSVRRQHPPNLVTDYLKILLTVGGLAHTAHSLAFVKCFAYKNPRRMALHSKRLRSRARNRRPQMIVLSWLWGIVKSVLNTIARVVVFALILVIALVAVGLVAVDGLPSNMVLELDLRKAMDDKSANRLLDIGQSKLSVMDILMTLDVAARDSRVKGIFMRV